MHKHKGPLGQVLPKFHDPKKESPRGATILTQRRIQSPRGPLLRRVSQMHMKKGPLGQVLPDFKDLRKESQRGPSHLIPKSLKSPRAPPEKRPSQWWRRGPAKWEKPGETLLEGP